MTVRALKGKAGERLQPHLDRCLEGHDLFGDDFEPPELERWYEQEQSGYFDLVVEHYGGAGPTGDYAYEYEALNRIHAIDWLLKRRYSVCVALGCAAGDDVAPLAPVVDEFLAIEPAVQWWRSEIGGKPAKYVKPTVSGDIDLRAASADLATSFGVLHHIPNVSHVVREVARVLAPGGIFVVREPISWMGDWRNPRIGLTANERGLPLDWFGQSVQLAGFTIVRRHLCMTSPLVIAMSRLGIAMPFKSAVLTRIDWAISEMLAFNVRYRRDSFVRKVAPGSAFWILQRRS